MKEEKPVNVETKENKPARQRRHKKSHEKPPTKVVIRRMPPTMTEEEFLKQTEPLPEHDSYYFVEADWSLSFDATCRAYIDFKKYEDVFLFRDRFDGYVFVDNKGVEYPAIVEFAPFQGIQKNKSRKNDPKVNTIEAEAHYKNFLQKLEEEREAAAKGSEVKLDFSLDRKKEEKVTSTPLLQYLANKKEKRREESKRRTEEKRRQREEENKRQRTQQPKKVLENVKENSTADKPHNKESARETDAPTQEPKNSRSKRRAQRDQRRREEHEQKKRERYEKEKREKRLAANEAGSSKNAGGTQKVNTKAKEVEAEQPLPRKEVLKYSERRERERQLNRKDKEQAPNGNNKKDQSAKSEAAAEVNESVKNFIRNAVQAKELEVEKIPATKQETDNEKSAEANKEKTDNKNKEAEKPKGSSDYKSSGNKNEGRESAEDKAERKQRLAEERRIRNKDRPSIQIYTPKPILQRLSEEHEPTSGRDHLRSNPTSDCESVRAKEDQHSTKKISRYSERRNERRNRDKRQDDKDESAHAGGNEFSADRPKFCKSKSVDGSSSSGSKENINDRSSKSKNFNR